ncbi:IS110 family transposase [Salmonella enterica subsp. enterica serovar Newport]|nr:IS110 family transposase [Salmonella enterica subsp. enterica serovar Newport]
MLTQFHAHYCYLESQIKELDRLLQQELKHDDTGQRLLIIPGVGPITASILSSQSQLSDGKQYASSKVFAASTGLVPRQYSTDGKNTLLSISKRGNKKLRHLLV